MERGVWMEEMIEKNPRFWDELHKGKKRQVIFFAVSMAMLISVYVPMVVHIKTVREKDILDKQVLEIDYSIVKEITGIEIFDNTIYLSGWILKPKSSNFNVKVILEETVGDSAVLFSTRTEQNVPEKIGINSSGQIEGCSFLAKINRKIINRNKSYEILLYINYKDNKAENQVEYNKKISTGRYFYNEKVYTYDPKSVSFPVFKNNFMKEVVEKGKLYLFNKERNIWVYVYENAVYWIIDEEYEFDKEGSTHIPYHIWTYEVSNLPLDRQQYGYDSRDFIYENNELILQDEEYRVASQILPIDFEPTYVITGEYDAEGELWIWENKFQMYFE